MTSTTNPAKTGTSRLLTLAVAAISVTAAALSWIGVFPTASVLRAATVAVAVPTVLVTWGTRPTRRRPAWLIPVTGAVAWILLIPVALPRTPGAAGPSIDPVWVLAALRGCWSGLLTTASPAPPDPSLLIGLYTLVWFAADATCEVLARSGRVLSALPFGAVLLILGVILGQGDRRSVNVCAGIFVFCALILMMIDSHGTPSWRVLTIALAWTAAVSAGAVAVAPATIGARSRQPFDPRTLVHPRTTPDNLGDPLDQVSAWLSQPNEPLFRVAAPAPQNWRLAVLNRFDGQSWTTGDTFLPMGTQVPGDQTAPGADAVASSRPIRQNVTIDALSGRWLPAAASPTTVAGLNASDLLADPGTGVLLSRSPLTPGRHYDVTSQIRDYTAKELSAAVPDPAAQQYTELPAGVPDALHQAADQAAAGATSPFQQAARLERYLLANEHNDSSAPPGHTYGHLAYFLGVSHQGTSEQFATAFAVMARSLGLPTRVAIGFGPGRQTAPGVWQVTGADVLVWPEVDFAGLGWVAFFPTPATSTTASAASAALPALGQTPEREELERVLDQPTAPAAASAPTVPAPRPQPTAGRGGRPSWWLRWAVPAAAAVLGYVAVVLAGPSLRRHRRRTVGSPAQRVQAAWMDALGLLRWIGVADVAASTNREVVESAAHRLAAHPGDTDADPAGSAGLADLSALAALADAAAFGGLTGPDSDLDLGERAWQHRDRLAVLVRREVGPRAALGRRLHPGALRGRP